MGHKTEYISRRKCPHCGEKIKLKIIQNVWELDSVNGLGKPITRNTRGEQK